MSYISGFMLGASLGKQLHSLFCQAAPTVKVLIPVQQEGFELVSSLPGRRRYRAGKLVGNEELARFLMQYLPQADGILSVDVNSFTGSVLIYFDQEAQMDRVEQFLRTKIFAEAAQRADEDQATINTSLCWAAGVINDYVGDLSGHLFDLKTLFSAMFIVQGLKKIILLGQKPSGPQLLWWAFSLLRGRRFVS